MTANGQTAAGVTVPGTKLTRDATELIRESASNLTYLHSRRVDRGECRGRDGSVRRAHLLWAAAALLLAVIADDAPGDPDAAALPPMHDLATAGPDRILLPALTRVALGLFERRAGHGPAEAALVSETAGLPGEMKTSAPPSAEPPWPGEPLTNSETRVLRYLPTHLAAPEIAAELCLSANTVRTHQRGLYRKLGAHSRREAVQRARAAGLLKDHPAGPLETRSAGTPRPT
jgi:LuxR family maltose regulon positive regulatory protein